MNTLRNTLCLISAAALNKKLTLKTITTPKITQILNILVDNNFLEYQTDSNNKIIITLKYKNQQPIIKHITFMGGSYKNNVSLSYLTRELSSKKSFYIIETNQGFKTLDSAIKCNCGGLILFKIII